MSQTRSGFAIQAMLDGYVVENYQTLLDGRESLDIQVKHIPTTAAYIKSNGGEVVSSYTMSHDEILRYRVAFPCPRCGGTGEVGYPGAWPCHACDPNGRVTPAYMG